MNIELVLFLLTHFSLSFKQIDFPRAVPGEMHMAFIDFRREFIFYFKRIKPADGVYWFRITVC